MLADLVQAVALAMAEQGLDVDVRHGVDVPAQELTEVDVNNLPKPRITFIENGLEGNLRDSFRGDAGGVVAPGVSVDRTFWGLMTRTQACEARIWGFDTSVDASGQSTATPLTHRRAVERLINDPIEATGFLPALYACLMMSNNTWEPIDGYYDNKQTVNAGFGALYVFHFNLLLTVVGRRVGVAHPTPTVRGR